MIGKAITRKQALKIATDTLKTAERERAAVNSKRIKKPKKHVEDAARKVLMDTNECR
jgi:hypothetical protein